MKDELGRKNMLNIVGLKAKTYSYLKDGCSEDKGAEKCVIKRKILKL